MGNAYAILSDKSKRERYDVYGAEAEVTTSRSTYRRSHNGYSYYYENDYTRGFEAEFTPEEIFNMFFGGGGHIYRQERKYALLIWMKSVRERAGSSR